MCHCYNHRVPMLRADEEPTTGAETKGESRLRDGRGRRTKNEEREIGPFELHNEIEEKREREEDMREGGGG